MDFELSHVCQRTADSGFSRASLYAQLCGVLISSEMLRRWNRNGTKEQEVARLGGVRRKGTDS